VPIFITLIEGRHGAHDWEIALTDDERAAVDGDLGALDRPLERWQ
jgi:hypothetical protein